MRVLNLGINKEIIKKNISWLLIIVLALSLITLRIINAKADDNKELRILEIQPGNSFTIKGDSNLTTTGIDTKNITSSNGAQNYKAIIEHVSMPEFIGKIDQLNGKYDVIVIGRKNSNLNVKDRDYSALNNNGSEFKDSERINGTTIRHDSIVDGNNDLLPNGNYAENDITRRKAKEITDYINSGQLVYINSSIFSIDNSNLKASFNNVTKGNLVKYTYESDLVLTNILNKYLESTINKKPVITVTAPTGDQQTDTIGNVSNRNMQFLVNMPQSADRFTVKLFLDINGDGVFSDKECYQKEANVLSQQNYKISYDIGTQFVGMLDWKVEVENQNGVKSYINGNIFFKTLKSGYKKNIRVLQVTPDAGLDLTTNDSFKKQMELKDYTVTMSKISASQFNSTAGSTLKLNGNYDMVIMGFSDSYNSKDISNQNALDELQSFVNSGQSVMFTHDTMTLRMDSSSTGKASQKLTTRFRDFVGQSRFVDKFRKDGKQTDAYKDYDVASGTYIERTIPHIDLGSNNNKIVGYALNGRYNRVDTTTVYKTNSGLINNYPYKLGDISVATTHVQWYQLNLEDPDVVPWYNLKSDGKLNQYDSRNNYYTYSKGNITYSGTGHSGGYSDDEFRLFVNTMIKAERGANHAPTITGLTEDRSTEVDAKGDYNFNIIVKDLDADQVRVNKVVVGGTLNADGKLVDNTGTIITQKETEYAKEGTTFPVNVSSSYFNGKVGQNINITIQAQDIRGALSEKTYQLKPINTPMISIQDKIVNCLVGDKVQLMIKLDKLNDNNNQINNISVESNQINTGAIDINKLSIVNQQNTYYLTGELTTNTMVSGEYVELKINYNVGSTQKQAIAKTIISSNNSEIKLKVEDINGNPLNVDTNAVLSNSNGQWDNTVIGALKGAAYTWPDSDRKVISDNSYNLKLDTPEGYKINSYTILNDKNEIKASGVEATTSNFAMNYDNPKAQIIYKVAKNFEDENIDSTIKILEVEPANSFKITNQNGYVKTGIESTTVKLYDNTIKQVRIDHISMPEFVGKVDKLNGKYDVIVIGRYKDTTNISDSKNKEQLRYIDYNNDSSINNDITNRKADEILDFINTGQLAYIDNSIVKSDSDIQNLNVYKKFSNLVNINTDNCNTESNIQQLGLTAIANQYMKLDDSYKNINFKVVNPIGDSPDDTKGDPDKRKMEFDISLASPKDEVVDINLYLDIDGDGIYEIKDDNKKQKGELVKSLNDVKAPQNNIKLEYQMPSDFVGYLSWKIEVVKENEVKSYTTGDMQYRSLTGERIPIKVLQVAPYDDANLNDRISGNLNLGPVDKYGNQRFNSLLDQLKDYNVTVDVMSIKEFNDRAGATVDQLKNTSWSSKGPLVLNGNYQMVIFGFADCYGSYDFSVNSCNALKEYINTGQGVLFTHDTIAPYFNGTNRDNNFRELSGQTTVKTFFDRQGVVKSQTKTVYQTNSALITNYPFKLDENIDIRRTHAQYYQLNLEDENVVPWYTDTPNTVTAYGSNRDYKDTVPQNIRDELTKNGLTETNMINDDFNSLSDTSEVNPYDVKNNYYTYSVGNITFSGTAENSRENCTPYPDTELKLFVNTISKAIRGANHAPVITVSNIYDGMEIDKDEESFKFSATFTDLDNDAVNTQVKVDGVTLNDYTKTNLASGSSLDNIEIPKSYYENKSSIKVEIIATDERGATSNEIFNINKTTLPIKVGAAGSNGLVGDILNTSISLKKINTDKKIIRSVKVELTAPDSKLVEYDSTSTSKLIEDLGDLDDLNEDNELKLQYKFKANAEVQGYKISGTVTYIYSDVAASYETHTKVVPVEIPISIRTGKLQVDIDNNTGRQLPSNLAININGGSSSKPLVSDKCEFNSLTTNYYKVSLNGLTRDYKIVNEAVKESSSGTTSPISGDGIYISYDNPQRIYTCSIINATAPEHGVYKGMENGIPQIDNTSRTFAKGSIIPMAASFDFYYNTTVKLELDSKLVPSTNIVGDIIIYKVNSTNGELTKVATMSGNGNNYEATIGSNLSSGDKILILYNIKPTTNGDYANYIKVGDLDRVPAEVGIGENLPDLF